MTDPQTLLRSGQVTESPPDSGAWMTGVEEPRSNQPSGTMTGERRRRHRSSPWETVGIALTGIGILLLMFFTYLYVFTPLTHGRDQHQLLQSLVGNPRTVYKLVAGHLPPQGRPIGILTIPALHQRQVIVMGTSSADLQEGPGLLSHTALPGSAGNAVVAGRRVTYGGPFSSIDTLVPGNKLQVIDGAGETVFRVSSVKTVAGEPDIVTHRGQRWLTLVTSNSPLGAGGHVVVVAKATSTQSSAASNSNSRDATLISLDGDPAAGLLALLWSVIFVIGLGATVYAVRRWRQVWLSYILAVPLLLACGLFACESLARCLPATL